jgi:hypothetical protein
MTKKCDICRQPAIDGQGFYGMPGDGGRSGALPGNCRHWKCHIEKYGKPEEISLTAAMIDAHTQRQLRSLAPVIKQPLVTKGSHNRSANAAREFKVIARYPAHGRTSVTIECPFCLSRFTAFVWSISGRGKKCSNCGALHTSFGIAYPISGNEDM